MKKFLLLAALFFCRDLSAQKILCYNIHHANPPSKAGVIDLEAIASVIRKSGADIVFLQEVDVNTRRSGSVDEAAKLGELTSLHHIFFKAINHDGGEYGVAILSRYELKNPQTIALPLDPASPGEPRVLGLAEVQTSGKKSILLACTHLDAQHGPVSRNLQAAEIVSRLKGEKRPVILAGDLNDTPDSEALGLILKAGFTSTCTDCPFTIPEITPKKTIDFILTRGGKWKVKKHEVIAETYASDHRPVFAELD